MRHWRSCVTRLCEEKQTIARLYLISFTMFVLSRSIDSLLLSRLYPVSMSAVSDLLQVLSILFLTVPLLVNFLKKKPLYKILGLTVAFFVFMTGFSSHSLYLVWLFLFSYACPLEGYKLLSLIVFTTSVMTLFVGMMSVVLGLDGAVTFVRGTGEVRHALGFVHPNSFGLYVLSSVFSLLVFRFGKVGLYDLLPVLIGIVVVWVVSGSRTTMFGLFVCYLILVCAQLFGRTVRGKTHFGFFCLLLFLCCAISSIGLAVYYDPNNLIMQTINSVFSGRLSYPHGLIASAGISPFGFDLRRAVDYVPLWAGPDGTIPIDNVYCKVLIAWGPILMVGLVISVAVAIVRLIRCCGSESLLLLAVIVISAILGLAENYAIDVMCMFPLVLIINNSKSSQSCGFDAEDSIQMLKELYE